MSLLIIVAGAVPGIWLLSAVWGPVPAAFLAGMTVSAWIGGVAHSLVVDGTLFASMGAEAERWTSAALRRAAQWRVVDAVEFEAGDVDHVAVGRSHVLAVETKWSSRRVRIDGRGVHGLSSDGLRQAAEGAGRIRRLLASKGLRVEVLPVLVLWGRVEAVEGGYQRVGDVRVLVGAQAEEWRERLNRLTGWSTSTAGVVETLEDYQRTYDRAVGRRRWAPWRRSGRTRAGSAS